MIITIDSLTVPDLDVAVARLRMGCQLAVLSKGEVTVSLRQRPAGGQWVSASLLRARWEHLADFRQLLDAAAYIVSQLSPEPMIERRSEVRRAADRSIIADLEQALAAARTRAELLESGEEFQMFREREQAWQEAARALAVQWENGDLSGWSVQQVIDLLPDEEE